MEQNTKILEQKIARLAAIITGQESAIAVEHRSIAKHKEFIKVAEQKKDEATAEIARLKGELIHEQNLERGRVWQRDNPEEHAVFMEGLKRRNQEGVIEGFLNGWWDLDDDGNMASPAKVFLLSDFEKVNNPLMAHVMAKADIFPSVSQARKNGWDKPLTPGEWCVTKKKIRVIVREK